MASSSDADVVVDSGSECETVRDTFEIMNQTLHEIMIIVATWKTVTPTKYTMHLMEGVDELEMKAVMFKSAIENMCENPEETYPINVQTTYDCVVANYAELNEVFKHMEAEKKRRLTPENSLD
jgi:ribonuclease HIII